ncbi:MAG: TIGR02147 family protein [Fibrobacter sp.]|uniref:TIGR02147 family protein n=1 Tax=Fibrobacter sp. TaxID=35828 RepID=UPI0025B9E291|nr:TIGR02147 family protein [Fibrobacter sp.]MBQ7080271.1 TIGR02147 family protein [Fibrobacter sp.]
MRPIVEYNDYRVYMADFYEERKRTSAFTWREFARIAGFTSPSYLKLVCDGKSSLSRVTMNRVAVAMGLVGYEIDYFEAMVNFVNAQKDDVKKEYLDKMAAISAANKVRLIDENAFEYYESWRNPVVRELAPMMPGAMPGEIAKKCCQTVSAQEVRKSLNFLENAGFLKQTRENVYEQTDKAVAGSKEALPFAIRMMHREMGRLGIESIDQFNAEDRHVAGVTLGVNREGYEEIVKELEACRKKIISIAASCGKLDQVYRLNLQFFPLSKKVKEKLEE